LGSGVGTPVGRTNGGVVTGPTSGIGL
jgi:hypothetical protein